MEIKVKVLILGILMLSTGFTVLLLMAPLLLAETETDIYVHNSIVFGAIFLVVGTNVTFIGLIEVATDKASLQKRKRKIVSIALIVIAIGPIVPHSVWTFLGPIYTPNWTFSLTTDKATYELGELVQIKVTLENHGSVGHWFISCASNPVRVIIMRGAYHEHVWYSSNHDRKTKVMIPARQSLERTFIWNASMHDPDTYFIRAYIPLSLDVSTMFFEDSTFTVEKKITLTST